MFKRSITLGELIAASMVVIGCVLSFWISTNVRLSVLENNRSVQESNYNEMKSDLRASFQELGGKVDKLNEGQNEIKISLQNKQDRK
jgi:hypothetical protein